MNARGASHNAINKLNKRDPIAIAGVKHAFREHDAQWISLVWVRTCARIREPSLDTHLRCLYKIKSDERNKLRYRCAGMRERGCALTACTSRPFVSRALSIVPIFFSLDRIVRWRKSAISRNGVCSNRLTHRSRRVSLIKLTRRNLYYVT